LSRTYRRGDTLGRLDPEEIALLEPNTRSDLPRSDGHGRDRRRTGDRGLRGRTSADGPSFRCVNCRVDVAASAMGTAHRNHCPACLWSRHVDESPGDRASDCLASMEPIAITVRGDGEWVLIHRCRLCDVMHSNRIAGDDNPLLLLRLAIKPLAQPPFPLDRLSRI
jgi:hypothetical protein